MRGREEGRLCEECEGGRKGEIGEMKGERNEGEYVKGREAEREGRSD